MRTRRPDPSFSRAQMEDLVLRIDPSPLGTTVFGSAANRGTATTRLRSRFSPQWLIHG